MPRKKTIQPPPDYVLLLGHDCVVEVRSKKSNLIYRGSHKRDAYEELRDRVLDWVIDQYLSSKGPMEVKKDIMKSASELDMAIGLSGKFTEITDIGSVRKRIYPYVKSQLDIFTCLVKRHNPNPN